jgi:hypothetical protein
MPVADLAAAYWDTNARQRHSLNRHIIALLPGFSNIRFAGSQSFWAGTVQNHSTIASKLRRGAAGRDRHAPLRPAAFTPSRNAHA